MVVLLGVVFVCIGIQKYLQKKDIAQQSNNVVIQLSKGKHTKSNNKHHNKNNHKDSKHKKSQVGKHLSKHKLSKHGAESYSKPVQKFIQVLNKIPENKKSKDYHDKIEKTHKEYKKLSPSQKNEVAQYTNKSSIDAMKNFMKTDKYKKLPQSKKSEINHHINGLSTAQGSSNNPGKFINKKLIQRFIKSVDVIQEITLQSEPNKDVEQREKEGSKEIENAYEVYKKLYSAYKQNLKVTKSENKDIKKAVKKLFDHKNIENMVWYGHETDENRGDHNKK